VWDGSSKRGVRFWSLRRHLTMTAWIMETLRSTLELSMHGTWGGGRVRMAEWHLKGRGFNHEAVSRGGGWYKDGLCLLDEMRLDDADVVKVGDVPERFSLMGAKGRRGGTCCGARQGSCALT
jgi:hypothetical protein